MAVVWWHFRGAEEMLAAPCCRARGVEEETGEVQEGYTRNMKWRKSKEGVEEEEI